MIDSKPKNKKSLLLDPLIEIRTQCGEVIERVIRSLYNFDRTASRDDLEIPPRREMGDFAFPCFSLAKELKASPQSIASAIATGCDASKPSCIERVYADGPYVNFFFSNSALSSLVQSIQPIYLCPKKAVRNETVLIEYVSPNTNKPLHLGHIRNATLGDSIGRILSHVGKKVIRASLINDRGVHICKSMVAYQWKNSKLETRNSKLPTPKETGVKGDHFVGDYYILFDKLAKKDPLFLEKAQHCLKKWEEGDKKTRLLWKKMNAWALNGINETYKRIGIYFDKTYFESEFYTEGRDIILNGLKKNIFKKDETGAVYADLSSFNLPNKILLRRDGTTLYITQDIFLAFKKWKEYKPTSSMYVIGSEQDLYLKQLFAILQLLRVSYADRCIHLSYGMVRLPEGKMKSREGTVVDADDLLDKLQSLVRQKIKNRGKKPSLKEITRRSSIVANAAIKFFMLEVNPKADIVFNPKESISFNGKTGPYIQYTYARLASILRKASLRSSAAIAVDAMYEWRHEKPLIVLLAQFRSVMLESAEHFAPSLLAQYLYALAKSATELYHELPVLTAEKNTRNARLSLIQKTNTVLECGLALLGIEILQEM